MNNPNDKPQAFLLLFLLYSEPIYAADLKMPANSYLRFCCLWYLFIWKRWCRYKTELSYPVHLAINRAFTESLPWFFRNRAQTYNSLCLQENTTVECEVSGLIFPVLVGNYKGQGRSSVAEEVGDKWKFFFTFDPNTKLMSSFIMKNFLRDTQKRFVYSSSISSSPRIIKWEFNQEKSRIQSKVLGCRNGRLEVDLSS